MFSRCLVCHAAFPPGEVLEHFPVGSRVAYDPERGRLWAVCGRCRRWTLAPIEERWEALEELERLVSTDERGHRRRARLLSSTERVALFRAGPLDVVRIGGADRTEESWWRYGRELLDRRARHHRISRIGVLAAPAAVVGGALTAGLGVVAAWALWERSPGTLHDLARWFRYGSAAWRGRRACPRCGWVFTEIPFFDRRILVLRSRTSADGGPGSEPGVTLSRRCPGCRSVERGGLRLEGLEASHILRRVLAREHFAGASPGEVRASARLVRDAGGAAPLVRLLAGTGTPLRALEGAGGLALEMALNEGRERALLRMELRALEARWREEEELAALVDGELSPLPVLEGLRRRVMGQTQAVVHAP